MSYKVVFVIAALCLAQVFAAEKPAEPMKLEEAFAKAQAAVTSMAADVQKVIGQGLPEPQKVADSIIQSGKSLAKEIQDIVTEISAKPDVTSAVSALARRFNSTVEDLQKQVPNVQAKASELQKNLQSGMQTLISETQKLADKFVGETDIKKSLESMMEQVSKTAVEVQKKMSEVVANNPLV